MKHLLLLIGILGIGQCIPQGPGFGGYSYKKPKNSFRDGVGRNQGGSSYLPPSTYQAPRTYDIPPPPSNNFQPNLNSQVIPIGTRNNQNSFRPLPSSSDPAFRNNLPVPPSNLNTGGSPNINTGGAPNLNTGGPSNLNTGNPTNLNTGGAPSQSSTGSFRNNISGQSPSIGRPSSQNAGGSSFGNNNLPVQPPNLSSGTSSQSNTASQFRNNVPVQPTSSNQNNFGSFQAPPVPQVSNNLPPGFGPLLQQQQQQQQQSAFNQGPNTQFSAPPANSDLYEELPSNSVNGRITGGGTYTFIGKDGITRAVDGERMFQATGRKTHKLGIPSAALASLAGGGLG